MRRKDHDESRLPLWAQRELGRLRREVEYQRQRGDRVETNEGRVGYLDGDQNFHALPERSMRFLFGPFGYIDVDWRERGAHEEGLYLNGSECLEVRPVSGNALTVRLGGR